MLRATSAILGVDEYFVPDEWGSINAVYLIPVDKITNAFRMKDESKYRQYKVEFSIAPPDSKHPLNKYNRRLILRKRPEIHAMILASVKGNHGN